MKKIKFGSVCSGIEAASVAWHPLGWEAAWLSEIEPFPSAVLAHHYPTVPNLGDMTTLPERILSGEVEAPDVFCGGTPCQAFSVAGLRNSLDDARGNLSLTFVGIANAIDHVRSVRSDDPAIIFWENVPGVLSTKDNAFGCFLAGLAGEDNPLEPTGGKWTNAGYVLGPKRAVAWRLLDAQYFGVAQRRRRVFVVASARNNFDPAAVLFEFDGVRRDSAPSREAGQAIAPCVTNGPPFSRTGNERVEAEAMVIQPVAACRKVALGEYANDDVASTMKARDYKEATDLVAQPIAFTTEQTPKFNNNQALTLTKSEYKHNQCVAHSMPTVAHSLTASRSSTQCPNEDTTLVPIALQDVTPREKAQNGRGWNDDGTAYTVDTHATQGVAQPIPINSMNAFRSPDADPTTGCGIGEAGEAMFTITKTNSHAVAQPIPFDTTQITSPSNYSKPQAGDPCHPLAAGAHPPAVAHVVGALACNTGPNGHDAGNFACNQAVDAGHVLPMAFQQTADCLTAAYGTKWNGNASATNGSLFAAQPIGLDEEQNAMIDAFGTLKARTAGGGFEGSVMQTNMAVRRLTPVECERLQGFPDGYTNIPWRKKDESPDGPRYKALGNSWAVPNVRWIGQRIQREMEKNDL